MSRGVLRTCRLFIASRMQCEPREHKTPLSTDCLWPNNTWRLGTRPLFWNILRQSKESQPEPSLPPGKPEEQMIRDMALC
jgi:hypothetical protein